LTCSIGTQFTGSFDNIPGYGFPTCWTDGRAYIELQATRTSDNTTVDTEIAGPILAFYDQSRVTEGSDVVNATVALDSSAYGRLYKTFEAQR
jgi:hypothetical protein